jgi:hypothetical protein
VTFRNEGAMAASVVRWLQSDGLAVRHEFSLPWGVCDILAARLRSSRVRRRLKLGQRAPVGPPLRVQLLTQIPDEAEKRCVRLETLYRRYDGVLDRTTVSAEVQRLVASRFVHLTRYGLQKRNAWYPLHDRIIAVELKLTRVSEALEQARRHLRIATKSYVALPMELARRVAQSDRRTGFRQSGVGLLGVSPRRCDVLLRSSCRTQKPDDVLQMHTIERFWRSRPKDS